MVIAKQTHTQVSWGRRKKPLGVLRARRLLPLIFFEPGAPDAPGSFYGRCFYRAILLSTARPLVSSSSLSQDINTVTGFSFAATGVVRVRESSAATSGAA